MKLKTHDIFIFNSLMFSVIFFSFKCYSQRLCEYGEYDNVLNKIKGIDIIEFSEINCKQGDGDELSYRFLYENGKLLKANYYGKGEVYSEIKEPCSVADSVFYSYNKKELFDTIHIKEDNINQIALLVYNNNNDIESIESNSLKIDYLYDENQKLKKLKKGKREYEYFWNKDSSISKIIASIPVNKLKQEIDFFYLDGKLKKVTYLRTLNDFKTRLKKCDYIYERGELCQVKCEIERRPNRIVYYDYEYNNEDKLVIKVRDDNYENISEYECYY